MGLSWYLMPDVFERFFGHFDRSPADYYELEHLDPHYRIYWKDGDRLDVTADREATKAAFESYEPGAGEALERYLEQARETYEVGMEQFVYVDRPRFRDYVDWDVLRSARGLGLLGSMDDHVSQFFDHEKLRQIVQYSLVFLGGSPTNTPALYNLMSHDDFELGVHYPAGGMASVVDGVVTLVEEQFSVSDFANRYNAREGTALGLAHTLRQTGPLRPGHRSSALDGLYYTGAYTTPGIGVPMCLVSGQHAAGTVLADATQT